MELLFNDNMILKFDWNMNSLKKMIHKWCSECLKGKSRNGKKETENRYPVQRNFEHACAG